MLHKKLEDAWQARGRTVPISPVLKFAPEGLVLGAGTIVVPANEPRHLRSAVDDEARILALLSAAYGKAVAPSVLGNIARAAKAWSEGDDCLAYIHLAHARLPELQDVQEASRRLFIVDHFMKAGTSPRVVLAVLGLKASGIDAVEKFYNLNEPRVPAGSGRTSGQWTRGLSFLATLAASVRRSLARFAAGLLATPEGAVAVAAVAAFGLLFFPSNKALRVEGPVPGLPGLRYSWNSDDGELHLIYEGVNGGYRTFIAHREDDALRDQGGRIIGVVLPNGTVAIELSAIFPEVAKNDEPKLCPDPDRDRRTNDKGLEYENYIKSLLNENPTPEGLGYLLPNHTNGGKAVSFDDCEHETGTMVEIKFGYTSLLRKEWGKALVARIFVNQATRQVDAAGNRPVRWYFSDQQTADFTRDLFKNDPKLKNIDIKVEP